MKLARVEYEGQVHTALVVDGRLQLCAPEAGDVLAVLATDAPPAPVATVDATAVRFLTPVAPGKVLCVGLNYGDHAAEAAREVPPHPSLFVRFADSLVAHGAPVVAPSVSDQFDYEGELAVVIGAPCWRIVAEEALTRVAGYTCLAENSVRDFQQHSRQATAGKNFFASGACGPWLATADELGPLDAVRVTTRLNDTVMQDAALGDLIYDIPTIIAYVSQFTPLRPGDIIATGTPSGVGAARTPPVWLKPGDRLEVEVSGIGVLANPVVTESDATSPFNSGAEYG